MEVVTTSRACHLHYAKSHFADQNARATVGGTGFAIAASKGHIFRVDGRLEDPSRIFVYTVVDRDKMLSHHDGEATAWVLVLHEYDSAPGAYNSWILG